MKTISAHLLVKNSKGQLLLTKRNDVPLWVIPGGHVEKKETAKKTAERELYEETGLCVRGTRLIARYTFPGGERQKCLYCGDVVERRITKSSEVEQAGWFSPTSLPGPMTVYEKRKIGDYFSFRGKVLVREDRLNNLEEIVNQFRHPIGLIIFFWRIIKGKVSGKDTFKFRLER